MSQIFFNANTLQQVSNNHCPPQTVSKHAINYWQTQIVYIHFEGVLAVCNNQEPRSSILQLVKK